MRTHLLLLFAFAVGVLLSWPRLPNAAGADAPAHTFSAGRAMAHVRAWATEPRPTGSAAHARVLEGLEAALGALGLPTEREQGDGLVNLVVRPTGGERTVWLVAHSDSVAVSPGAADDGLGLSVIVEVARALTVNGRPDRLGVLVTDGEERGLLGAKLHARQASDDARLVLNIEARGSEGPAYMFQTSGPTEPLLAAWSASGCGAQATSLARGVYELLPNDTDFTVFRKKRWWGYDFALIQGAWRYHTPDDTPDGLDPRSVQQVGDCVLGLAREWLQVDVAGGSDAALVYAQIAGHTVVGPAWLPRLLGLLLAGALLWCGGRRSIHGGLAWVVSLFLAFGLGFALLLTTARLRADFWERPAEVEGALAHYVVAGVVTFGVAVLALGATRRWGTRGWHTWSGIVGAALAVAQPAMGYVFLPGAAVSAASLTRAPLLALPFALLGGALAGPVLLALFPALTSRATPILCVAPLLLLPWLAPPPRGTSPGPAEGSP